MRRELEASRFFRFEGREEDGAIIGPVADNLPILRDTTQRMRRRAECHRSCRDVAEVGNGKVLRSKGTGFLTGSDEEIAAAVANAQRADLVILTLGESPEMSGEAASRSNLGLPGRQQELLEAVVKTGKPVVLILFSGRPLTRHGLLSMWPPCCSVASRTEAGPALARTLFGESNPAASWCELAAQRGQEPLYYNALTLKASGQDRSERSATDNDFQVRVALPR